MNRNRRLASLHRRPSRFARAASSVCLVALGSVGAAAEAIRDEPFVQERCTRWSVGDRTGDNDVRAITIAGDQSVWAATATGVFRLDAGDAQSGPMSPPAWESVMPPDQAGPTFDATADRDGAIWVAAWNGLYRSDGARLVKIDGVGAPIAVVCAAKSGVVALSPEGMWFVCDGKVDRKPLPCSGYLRDATVDADDTLWIATDAGLYAWDGSTCKRFARDAGLLSANVASVDVASDGAIWLGGLGRVEKMRDGKFIARHTPDDGLPSAVVKCMRIGPGDAVWAGTAIGAARFDGKRWSVRHSKRWLPNDEVRDIAFDRSGTAWIATAGGVGAIHRCRTTLAEKQEHYMRACQLRHVRKPGLIGKCRLETPGDLTTWRPLDDDNDGQYTAMYLAMESFRYAVTKSPDARANARRAFEALRLLQTVTGTPGFVARTVIPATWTRMFDPNRKLTDRRLAEQRVRDPRHKYVPVRWHRSRDGKWLWKGDTSSDEITGHFFGYLVYHDLAADRAERRRVADHVRRIMDGVIEAGYVLKGLDGKHTRWAVWSPDKLNHDPDWQFERGINSVEILSFLKATYHMTGDETYQRCFLDLLDKHNYRRNVLEPRSTDPAWRTHIDDELLALAYPALLLHEKDPDLKRLFKKSLDTWHPQCRADGCPYFDFTYVWLGGETIDLAPAMAFLRNAPLDLIRWRIDNGMREDIRVVRKPELEALQTHRLPPAGERGVMRWDKNPWLAVQGDGGHTESDGVYWLLPYWMGRYCGLIGP